MVCDRGRQLTVMPGPGVCKGMQLTREAKVVLFQGLPH